MPTSSLSAYGCLHPLNSRTSLSPIYLYKPSHTFGRDISSDVRLAGPQISHLHCVILRRDHAGCKMLVSIQDRSTNGTWINGVLLGFNQTRILRDGHILAFATPVEQEDPENDYRYIFRALQNTETGFHAHYDLAHELGHGAFATVMKAIHRTTGQSYAVKIIRREAGERHLPFAHEIAILDKLRHVNVNSLHEYYLPQDAEAGSIYLVLELVEGGDLLDYVMRKDGLAETTTREFARQICKAISYIHTQGVAHRDLKPENILLSKNNTVVKVADFGLAKLVGRGGSSDSLCGTPDYLPPEMFDHTFVTHGRSDFLRDSWSTGVIVFVMLTNCIPFIGNDVNIPISQRVHERRIDWGCLDRIPVSNEGRDFLERLLDKNPATRMSVTAALGHPWLRTGQSHRRRRQKVVPPRTKLVTCRTRRSRVGKRGTYAKAVHSREQASMRLTRAAALAKRAQAEGPRYMTRARARLLRIRIE